MYKDHSSGGTIDNTWCDQSSSKQLPDAHTRSKTPVNNQPFSLPCQRSYYLKILCCILRPIWSQSYLLFTEIIQAIDMLDTQRKKNYHWYIGINTHSVLSSSSSPRIGNTIIFDTDLKVLIRELQQQQQQQDDSDTFAWEDVINKISPVVSYNAKCCRLKNGSLKYFSITTFENCPTELLRDLYMDNEYRKKWERTVLDQQQLQLDTLNMVEYGLTIRKFPFLTPREYVLVWRIWEGKYKAFYCLVKDCEHPLAPQRKRYVRVGSFRSGWSIKKVAGRDACQITMVHQEDAGLNVEMAKLAFAKGIWSYICKMDAFREYSSWMLIHPMPIASLACSQIPADYESSTEPVPYHDAAPELPKTGKMGWQEKALANKWLGNGLLLVGGVVYLSRGRSSFATQLAMACFLKKLTGQGQEESSKEKLEESKRRNFDMPVGITG